MECDKCSMQLHNEEIKFCPNCGSHLKETTQVESQEIRIKDERGDSLTKEEAGFSRSNSEYIKPEIVNPGALPDGSLKDGKNNTTGMSFRIKILLAFVPVLAVVLLILFFVFKPVDHEAFHMISDKAIEVYYDSANRSTVIFNTSGEILHKLNVNANPIYNLDRTSAFLYTIYYVNDIPKIQIYYVDANKLVDINHDVDMIDISDEGNYVIYSTQNNEEGNCLYLYDVEGKKETVLDQSKENRFSRLRMSPDGKTIIYNTFPKDVQDISQKYPMEVFQIRQGGEPVSLGKDINALAVSDHGEYLYLCDYNFENQSIKSLYLKKGDKTTKLFEDFVDSKVYFNRDYTEVLFTDGDKTYLYTETGDAIPVADDAITEVLMPPKCISYSNMNSESKIRYYDFDSFYNKVILCDDNTLRRIDKKEEAPILCTVNTNLGLTLSEDGNSLLYLSAEGNVQRINDLSGECTEETYINDPYSFIASGDLSEVYYRKDDQLYYKRGTFEPKLIADNVSSLIWNTEQTQALFEADKLNGKSILYSSSHGDEPEVALDYGNHIIQKLNYGVIVQELSNSGNDVFYNTDGNRMKQVVNNTKNYN